jgi:hypothetical protein
MLSPLLKLSFASTILLCGQVVKRDFDLHLFYVWAIDFPFML